VAGTSLIDLIQVAFSHLDTTPNEIQSCESCSPHRQEIRIY